MRASVDLSFRRCPSGAGFTTTRWSESEGDRAQTVPVTPSWCGLVGRVNIEEQTDRVLVILDRRPDCLSGVASHRDGTGIGVILEKVTISFGFWPAFGSLLICTSNESLKLTFRLPGNVTGTFISTRSWSSNGTLDDSGQFGHFWVRLLFYIASIPRHSLAYWTADQCR